MDQVHFITRSALIVNGREPFLQWARSMRGNHWNDSCRKEASRPACYLVPLEPSLKDINTVLEHFWEMIFEEMLGGWTHDWKKWPPRNLNTFKEWFEIELNSNVMDTFRGKAMV